VSLSPGTRIPGAEELTPYEAELLADGLQAGHVAEALFSLELRERARPGYYRGLVEGGVLGIIAGSLVTACCLALAWSHWG